MNTSSTKSTITAREKIFRVAIVGGGTLKGKEIVEVLGERNFPYSDIKLLDSDEAIGQIESAGGDATFIQSLRTEQFERTNFTFFASAQAATLQFWQMAKKAGSGIIDLSYALDDQPGVAIRSPWVERARGATPQLQLQPEPVIVAHPAATALALISSHVRKLGAIQRYLATVYEPVSEKGQKGMDELHEQTVNLLSFQPVPKHLFDIQVVFNLVSRYGADSPHKLASVKDRILRHYAIIAGNDAVCPDVFMVQAPVFHGYIFSIYLELPESVSFAQLTGGLAGEHLTLVEPGDDPPSNVLVAGQNDIMVSVEPGAAPGSFWLWCAADNLRISATMAVEIAESLTAGLPRGKVQ